MRLLTIRIPKRRLGLRTIISQNGGAIYLTFLCKATTVYEVDVAEAMAVKEKFVSAMKQLGLQRTKIYRVHGWKRSKSRGSSFEQGSTTSTPFWCRRR